MTCFPGINSFAFKAILNRTMLIIILSNFLLLRIITTRIFSMTLINLSNWLTTKNFKSSYFVQNKSITFLLCKILMLTNFSPSLLFSRLRLFLLFLFPYFCFILLSRLLLHTTELSLFRAHLLS